MRENGKPVYWQVYCWSKKQVNSHRIIWGAWWFQMQEIPHHMHNLSLRVLQDCAQIEKSLLLWCVFGSSGFLSAAHQNGPHLSEAGFLISIQLERIHTVRWRDLRFGWRDLPCFCDRSSVLIGRIVDKLINRWCRSMNQNCLGHVCTMLINNICSAWASWALSEGKELEGTHIGTDWTREEEKYLWWNTVCGQPWRKTSCTCCWGRPWTSLLLRILPAKNLEENVFPDWLHVMLCVNPAKGVY